MLRKIIQSIHASNTVFYITKTRWWQHHVILITGIFILVKWHIHIKRVSGAEISSQIKDLSVQSIIHYFSIINKGFKFHKPLSFNNAEMSLCILSLSFKCHIPYLGPINEHNSSRSPFYLYRLKMIRTWLRAYFCSYSIHVLTFMAAEVEHG